jgi:hypothetical protein
MMVGIVAEGSADIAVIRNILKGKLGVQGDETQAIRPRLNEDKTDRVGGEASGYRAPTPEEFSNWTLVLEECRTRTKIEDFLRNDDADARLVVIHIDTAEAHHPGYDIPRPDRQAPDYSDLLRALVVAKIDGLLGPDLAAGVRHAIAVEETDAWVLTIHDDQGDRDTCTRPNPKARLEHVLDGKAPRGKTRERRPREGIARARKKSEYERYDELSSDFRDGVRLHACAERNRSLRIFVDSL